MMTRIFAAMFCATLALPAAAQETVTLSEFPLLGSDTASLCGTIKAQTETPLTAETRAVLEAELRRRGGFNSNDIRVLLRSDADVGVGMSLQGLRCALGGQVEVVHTWTYGPRQTWQVRLFNHFERYTIGFAYMDGRGSERSMQVRSLI